MRFLPINQENVNNAANLYMKIQNLPPHNMNWSYSSAYARLSAEAKCVGFEGYITFGDGGYPIGFAMGHCEVQANGKNNFILRELCFEAGDEGKNGAAATLLHLMDELKSRGVETVTVLSKATMENKEFFMSLGFSQPEPIMSMQKNV